MGEKDWISVSNRLPEAKPGAWSESVVVWNGKSPAIDSYYRPSDNRKGFWLIHRDPVKARPSHWMPLLPPAPEESPAAENRTDDTLGFEPAQDYDALRKQALAMASLVKAMEQELSMLRAQTDTHHMRDLLAQLDSERAANARLTEEVERLSMQLSESPVDIGSVKPENGEHANG